MKWFQHQSDAYTDLALQEIITEFGIEGYGLFWICCELVAQQGKNYTIQAKKGWKKALQLISRLPEKKIDKILQKFAELDLISKKAYKHGHLAIPKMRRYSDDYTKKIQRRSGHTPDNVHQDKNRIDKIRIDKNKLEKIGDLKYFEEKTKEFLKRNAKNK